MNPSAVNTVNEACGLIDLVGFKWLMAGEGWRIDLTRLQTDAEYASVCLQRALATGSEVLRRCSAQLWQDARL